MPLLKRKAFEKAKVPEFLRDDEEVFHCEVTNEIFRDYEEFCERTILVNSMVWTCCMTGRNNLTYGEALESEENARQSLRDFPSQLRIPLLYVASKTKRGCFTDMSEDVWAFVKDRYFVGEIVEALLHDNCWYEVQVLQVMAPTNEQINAYNKDEKSSDNYACPAALFRYEVEQTTDDNQVFIVDASKVRRKKSNYTRDKNKLFLKQFAEASPDNIWQIKEPIMQKYGIRKVTFDQIFDGPFPDFNPAKPKKSYKKQETLMKYLTKNGEEKPKKVNNGQDKGNKKDLLEEMKRRSEQLKQQALEKKKQKVEEQEKRKQERKEENNRLANLLKEWNKQREDLELEDHKKLPTPSPVISNIPSASFGDVLMLLEFFNSFSGYLGTRKCFVGGVNLGMMERALTEVEINGPYSDLVKLLLNAIFSMQCEENAEIKNDNTVHTDDGIKKSQMVAESVRFATIAASWCASHQGIPLANMLVDGLSLTEVLRLHLLSSGSRKSERVERWQYQQRGGYMYVDDPGMTFRLEHPEIVVALATKHVTELSFEQKLSILQCLMNQVLTYADFRDAIEEQLEKNRQAILDLRSLQLAERKRETEMNSQKLKLKRELKQKKEENPTQAEAIDKEYEKALARLQLENDRQQKKYEYQCAKLSEQTKLNNTRETVLGLDRAFRRYIFIESIPALFIETISEPDQKCLEKIISPKPQIIDSSQNALDYIRYLYADNLQNNNKENSLENQKTPTKKNGLSKNNSFKIDSVSESLLEELLMCTGKENSCPVHAKKADGDTWAYFDKVEDIENLIASLNKRGIRESKLKLMLENSKEYLEEQIKQCPTDVLSGNATKKVCKSRYDRANFDFPPETSIAEILELTLRDFILDLEQQIFSGGLGVLQVANRNAWKKTLENRVYDLQYLKTEISNGVDGHNVNDEKPEKLSNGSRSNSPETVDVTTSVKTVIDPGKYLTYSNKTSTHDNDEEKYQKAIIGLATALQALGYSVNEKYLNRPLGQADIKKKKDNVPKNYLSRWSESLMLSTSFSQVFFHYSTLETCVALHKSALNARCYKCRKCNDDDKLLLCDGCNRGLHLYCIEPKLTTVPKGDWFCERCKPIETIRSPPKRKRKTFSENSDDEEELSEENKKSSNDSDFDGSSDSVMDTTVDPRAEVCAVCKENDPVIVCDSCSKFYHQECIDPPLRRIPRGEWHCPACKQKEVNDCAKRSRSQRAENRNIDKAAEYGGRESSPSASSSEVDENSINPAVGSRNCARQARHKIHGFARTLRRQSVDDSDSEGEFDSTPPLKGSSRRSRRAVKDFDNLTLHNAALQELLADILKYPDAWPFTQPVQKRDVPDYFEVIKHPMDFGTIKYKLNMGKYQYDYQLMADAMLVFENCNTYNNSDATVYKCGVKVLKYFKQRATELNLLVPKIDSGLHEDADDSNSCSDNDAPAVKKMRIS